MLPAVQALGMCGWARGAGVTRILMLQDALMLGPASAAGGGAAAAASTVRLSPAVQAAALPANVRTARGTLGAAWGEGPGEGRERKEDFLGEPQ